MGMNSVRLMCSPFIANFDVLSRIRTPLGIKYDFVICALCSCGGDCPGSTASAACGVGAYCLCEDDATCHDDLSSLHNIL